MKRSVKPLCFLILSLNLLSCTDKSKPIESQVLRVKTVSVCYSPENQIQQFPFISKPYRSSELSFRIGGLVQTMDIHSGKYYAKGEVIASIDPRDYQIRFDKAKALYEQMLAEYKRTESLYKLNNISASVYEKAKSDYESSLAAYNASKNELNDTKLCAPFDGYVQEVFFERYQEVRASQPICSFIDINEIKIEVFVPQQLAMSVDKGEKIDIQFDALSGENFVATVEQISKGATQNNLSFLITALLPNPGRKLPSGMSGHALFDQKESKEGVLTVPQSVVRNNPTKGTYLWIIEDGKAKQREVTTGKLSGGGKIEILNGLSGNEKVISTCMELLSENAQIEQVDE